MSAETLSCLAARRHASWHLASDDVDTMSTAADFLPVAAAEARATVACAVQKG